MVLSWLNRDFPEGPLKILRTKKCAAVLLAMLRLFKLHLITLKQVWKNYCRCFLLYMTQLLLISRVPMKELNSPTFSRADNEASNFRI